MKITFHKKFLPGRKKPKFIIPPLDTWGAITMKPEGAEFFNIFYSEKKDMIRFLEDKFKKPYFLIKKEDNVQIAEIQITMKQPVIYERD